MYPKYSILEVERRWLAIVDQLPDISTLPRVVITDKYIETSRLRLRVVEQQDGTIYKLSKKYGKTSDIAEPITNIYLDENEYRVLSALPGRILVRERFIYEFKEMRYSINKVSHGSGPTLIEVEFPSEAEAMSFRAPAFCGREVIGNEVYEAIRFAL